MNFLTKLNAYRRLGLRSLRDVLIYRLGLKTGLHPVLKIGAPAIEKGDFFKAANIRPNPPARSGIWQNGHWAFGRKITAVDTPPDWHANILTGKCSKDTRQPWHKISAFNPELGDIKTIWEASRADWALAFAQNAASGDAAAVHKLNQWLRDWTENNPAYLGPNWMCGQEASLRLTHIILAATLLGQDDDISAPLQSFVLAHLRRIAPTIAYARGQDNNHATSEAMALFVGGLWLNRYGKGERINAEAMRYCDAGRKLLEERADRLIFDDGGFAQYSIVYHRLMLDALCLCEYYRRRWDAPNFRKAFYKKARAASIWLAHFTDTESGDAPNMGSNDGAFFLPIGSGGPRDFRPSCALASYLFEGRTRFADAHSASTLLVWLDIKAGTAKSPDRPNSRLFNDSGIISLSKGKTRLYMRLPGGKFRPHQADALHVDIWHGPDNLLLDAGSFSYAEADWEYYPSTAAHNSICFDGQDQMPRLGRFLFGKWLKRGATEIGDDWGQADYHDARGNRHARLVKLVDEKTIVITDEISGSFHKAVVKWRLSERADILADNGAENSKMRLYIHTDGTPINPAQTAGRKSLSYLQSEEISVLETEFSAPEKIITTINLV